RCGIDSWFLPQDEALAMEQEVRDGRAVAVVKIDSRGNAALVDVRVLDGA
ncbi:MAG: GDYXXLXY domain-containing protein, partial [Nocardioidaceae bacterium]|nr:GDYXXLXY domain-containing protein [Nocardioidaceae bacterium]